MKKIQFIISAFLLIAAHTLAQSSVRNIALLQTPALLPVPHQVSLSDHYFTFGNYWVIERLGQKDNIETLQSLQSELKYPLGKLAKGVRQVRNQFAKTNDLTIRTNVLKWEKY